VDELRKSWGVEPRSAGRLALYTRVHCQRFIARGAASEGSAWADRMFSYAERQTDTAIWEPRRAVVSGLLTARAACRDKATILLMLGWPETGDDQLAADIQRPSPFLYLIRSRRRWQPGQPALPFSASRPCRRLRGPITVRKRQRNTAVSSRWPPSVGTACLLAVHGHGDRIGPLLQASQPFVLRRVACR
jgi:hypothetical protein